MEDVSDPPFRAVCKRYGADLMYTEFISSEGLIRDAAKSKAKLDIFEYERPIGIQIFGSDIDSMREATEIATAAGPDLIDTALARETGPYRLDGLACTRARPIPAARLMAMIDRAAAKVEKMPKMRLS